MIRYAIGIFFLTCLSFNIYAIDLFDAIKSSFTPNYEEPVSRIALPAERPAINRTIFVFDPQHLQWAVYDKQGKRVGVGRASGGANYCKDIHEPCRTVKGEFTVFRKENIECTSKTFPIDEGGGAPMPHCMFFHEGYAIHGSNNVPEENRSHGCIRVTKKAAEWINTNYINPGSMVIVMPYSNKTA